MGDYDEPISDAEKVKIVSNFIKSAPPGEFNEVFNDVRILLANDRLLKEEASGAFAEYDLEQFTPCKVSGSDDLALITKHGKLDANQFFDPASKQQFRYDHLRKEANEVEPHAGDESNETFRSAVDSGLRKYLKSHYPSGAMSVYSSMEGSDVKLTICIEDHQFQPHNFWNGRWRSEWTVVFNSTVFGMAEVKGHLKLQVHYYEDGNVQLVSNKEFEKQVNVTEETLGDEIAKFVESSETEYQRAIGENYQTMSDTTFKALRRQLPITRTKVDWNKIVSYRIGQELKN